MPNRPLHPCNAPSRCPTLIPAGQRLCLAHQRQVNREYNQHRPARHAFYQTKEWRQLSKQVLEERPWCACGARATQADHIISIKKRPDLRLERITSLAGAARVTAGRRRWRTDAGGNEEWNRRK